MTDYEYKQEAATDYDYGCRPSERSMEEHIDKGIINVDKPAGPTSHEIDTWVKEYDLLLEKYQKAKEENETLKYLFKQNLK